MTDILPPTLPPRPWHERLVWPLLAIPMALWYIFAGFAQGFAATPHRQPGETCIWTGLALLLLALAALPIPALRRWTIYGMATATAVVVWALS